MDVWENHGMNSQRGITVNHQIRMGISLKMTKQIQFREIDSLEHSYLQNEWKPKVRVPSFGFDKHRMA